MALEAGGPVESSLVGGGSRLNRRLQRIRGDLYAMARSRMKGMVRPTRWPSDVVQEAFLEAFLAREELDRKDSQEFRAWLAMRLTSRLVDEARRAKRAPATIPLMEVEEERAPAESRRGVLEELRASEAVRRFWEAFEGLTPEQREALIGRRVEGLSLRELAVRMGRTQGGVAKLVERAVRRLRLRLRASDVGE
jgi:RNA polymerase sigma-70 factor (ECF subfamily)